MRRLHHRDPGPALALLGHPKVYLEVIVDFIRLHPSVVRFVVKVVGRRRVVLITDSMSATGLPGGVYELGGLRVKVERGSRGWRTESLRGAH